MPTAYGHVLKALRESWLRPRKSSRSLFYHSIRVPRDEVNRDDINSSKGTRGLKIGISSYDVTISV